MGWTWGANARLLLQYPKLAEIPALLDRWPSLKELAEKMAREEGRPDTPSKPSASVSAQPPASPREPGSSRTPKK